MRLNDADKSRARLSIKIQDLRLYRRWENALLKCGIKTVLDIVRTKEEELLLIPGFGPVGVSRTKRLIKRFGVGWDGLNVPGFEDRPEGDPSAIISLEMAGIKPGDFLNCGQALRYLALKHNLKLSPAILSKRVRFCGGPRIRKFKVSDLDLLPDLMLIVKARRKIVEKLVSFRKILNDEFMCSVLKPDYLDEMRKGVEACEHLLDQQFKVVQSRHGIKLDADGLSWAWCPTEVAD